MDRPNKSREIEGKMIMAHITQVVYMFLIDEQTNMGRPKMKGKR